MNREFLLTNGIGGYSSSTQYYSNTRKYHGLLVAARPDLRRYNVVNRLEEEIIIQNESYPISTNIFKGNIVSPKGHKNISGYGSKYFPEWHYCLPGVIVEKRIALEKGKNKVVVSYKINNSNEHTVQLKVTPLITFRDIHKLRRYTNKKDHFAKYQTGDELLIILEKENYLNVNFTEFDYENKSDIYFDSYYPIEDRRGYDAIEDLQTIGSFTTSIAKGISIFDLEFEFFPDDKLKDIERDREVFDMVAHHKNDLLIKFYNTYNIDKSDFVDNLVLQADQFVINQLGTPAIIAGYHWFNVWGRDTFMSFKGLLLVTERYEDAKRILLSWNKFFKNGMLPNQPLFSDYNSLDSILWYGIMVWEYLELTNDIETIKTIIPNLEETIQNFEEGTNNVYIDQNGFINDTNNHKGMTWMDAMVDNKPVIDRSGYAVEIQALWYNFLKALQKIKEKVGDTTHLVQIKNLTTKISLNFEDKFWNEKNNCLYDVIREEYKDESIRPNQLFTLYLPFKLLGQRRAKKILITIEEKLLTDVGLKTLPEEDKNFTPFYTGNQRKRDLAYHQGTVWTFLLGMYLIGYLKINRESARSKRYVNKKIQNLSNFLDTNGLQMLPEIFEAKTLKPVGCISQSWSVGFLVETIALLSEDKIEVDEFDLTNQ